MAIQIVMDRTGDSRHSFDPNNAQELAKAEQRFCELTKVGFTAAVRAGAGQVSQSDRSTQTRKKPCSSPGWSAGRNVQRHVAPSAMRALANKSRKDAIHQPWVRANCGGPVLAASAGVAVAGATDAVCEK